MILWENLSITFHLKIMNLHFWRTALMEYTTMLTECLKDNGIHDIFKTLYITMRYIKVLIEFFTKHISHMFNIHQFNLPIEISNNYFWNLKGIFFFFYWFLNIERFKIIIKSQSTNILLCTKLNQYFLFT